MALSLLLHDLGDDLSRYEELFEPKTHEKDSSSELYGPLEAMIRAINQSSEENFEASMAEHLDLRMFVTTAASKVSSQRPMASWAMRG